MDKNGLNANSLILDETILKETLGKAYSAYEKTITLFDKHELTHQWVYYRDGGWLLKVQNKKKKTIVWAAAFPGYMKATVYFPEKYIDGVFDLDIPKETKEGFRNTKRVGKSLPCMFEIKNQTILKIMEKVIEYKLKLK